SLSRYSKSTVRRHRRVSHFEVEFAEYRWIALLGEGRRINMPWWGGFDPRVWDLGSILDFMVPMALCTLVFVVARRPCRQVC
ncbi:hypothetical protein ACV1DK_21300, partial [Aeromonas taiwanensis]